MYTNVSNVFKIFTYCLSSVSYCSCVKSKGKQAFTLFSCKVKVTNWCNYFLRHEEKEAVSTPMLPLWWTNSSWLTPFSTSFVQFIHYFSSAHVQTLSASLLWLYLQTSNPESSLIYSFLNPRYLNSSTSTATPLQHHCYIYPPLIHTRVFLFSLDHSSTSPPDPYSNYRSQCCLHTS